MQSDQDSIDKIRNAIEDENLTVDDWEEGFLDSIEERIDEGRELTSKQRMMLGKIQEKISAW